ncbi:TonB-dependent receptor [Xanthomonas campestris pv. phormiicola]|nr:TonB-dependent receptor [Xanthomonas campestris pv. phormiicola]UYC17647.1 TonB-dependent receptor [Xanthomonas campestris pv. phormiicola]
MKSRNTTLALSIMATLHLSANAAAQTVPTDSTASADSDSKSGEKTVQQLDTITVTGYRASLEKSQAVKRSANAIVDAISAEDIGKFPDTNAAESLSHLPGISVDRQFGEGEKVSINGTDPALNRVLVNGQTIASGDWGGNPTDTSGRTFNYTLLSPEIIGLMQVYKSPEAHIDEGSIGGTVMISTRKPLDLPKNTIRGSLGYSYNDRSGKSNPRGSALWSWKNDDETLGLLVAATHDKEEIDRAGIEFFGYTTGASIPGTASISGSGDTATAKVPVGINSSYFEQTRQRDGVQAALQWKPNEQNEFNLTGIYIRGVYNNYSQSRYICPGCNSDLAKVTSATVDNGYITSASVSSDTGNGQPYAQLDTNYRKTTVTTKSLNLRHDFYGDNWVLTSQMGTTGARGGKDPEYLMKFLLQNGGYDFSYDGSNTSVNYDDASAGNWGLTTGQQAGGIYYSVSHDNEKYFQFDAARDVSWGPINKLLLGVKYINHENSNSAWGSSLYATSDVSLSDFGLTSTPSGLYDGLGASGDLVNWSSASLSSVIAYLKSLGDQGHNYYDYSSSFDVKEITKDAYAQANYEWGKFRGNFGVRLVDTTDKSNYWATEDSGSTYYLQSVSKDYFKPLPSFNIAYDLTDDAVLRFSAAKVIARPRYSDLAGAIALSESSTGVYTASGGNPDLKPYESTNYDLAAEWYFNPSSMVGMELFYRDIGTYIVTTTSDQQLQDSSGVTHTYSVSSPVNASNATVSGASAMYQQSFGLGFGLQANYTYATANTSNGLNMPYLSKNTYNVIPYWEHGPWMVRVNYSWRSEYFTQIGRLNSTYFADAYKELDLSASYNVNKWLSINFSATNLLDSTYYWYNKVKYAPIGEYKNGRSYQATLNFKF